MDKWHNLPQITRIFLTPKTICTKHDSKKKVVSTQVQTKLVKKAKKQITFGK